MSLSATGILYIILAGLPTGLAQQTDQKPLLANMKFDQTVGLTVAAATLAHAAPTDTSTTSAAGNTLTPLVYRPLPLGSITPTGWLHHELDVSANGLAGHEADFYKYVAQSSWLGGSTEYSALNEGFPYWFNGLVPMAYSLDDARLKSQVHSAAQYVLDHQQADGWLGPETGTMRTFWGRYPLCLGLVGLAEANSSWSSPVVSAMYRFNDLMYTMMQANYSGYIFHQGDELSEDNFSWGRVRSQDMMISLMWLYENHPKDNHSQRKLLFNLRALHSQGLNWEDWYNENTYIFDDLYDLPQNVTDDNYPYLHGVNVAQGLKAAAVVRRLTGNDSLASTAANGVQWTFQYHGAASGTVLADERIDGVEPYAGSELCTAVETMYSLSYLYQALGTNSYADRAELAAYNALPVSMTDDWWAHQYMAMPNQPFSKNLSHTPFYNTNSLGQTFGLEPNYPCCTVNHPQGLPKFVSNSYVLSGDSGLVHALLSPSTVSTTLANGAKVTVKCTTNYPFAETLSYTVSTTGGFDLFLRVPAWASSTSLSTTSNAPPSSTVDTTTNLRRVSFTGATAGTTFTYTLQASVRTEPRANKTIAVYRGALLYALSIPSTRTSTPPRAYDSHAFLPTGYAPPQARDYIMLNASAWNIAIDPSTLHYVGPSTGSSPAASSFAEGAPANYITALGCEIAWPLFRGSVPGAVPAAEDRTCLGPAHEVRLVPYGSAKLHMAELPTVELAASYGVPREVHQTG